MKVNPLYTPRLHAPRSIACPEKSKVNPPHEAQHHSEENPLTAATMPSIVVNFCLAGQQGIEASHRMLICDKTELFASLVTGIQVHLPEWDNAKQPATLDVHICKTDQSCIQEATEECKAAVMYGERAGA